MEPTVQQKHAIDFRGHSMLLAAGAGSGKTTTLTERIIRRITDPDDPLEIRDCLVVTFTNAAAADLENHIEKALTERAAGDIRNRKAKRQLSQLRYAEICTINAFCFRLVKKHFEVLGLPSNLRIADDAEAKMLKDDVIRSVIENQYSELSPDNVFFRCVELFSGGKSDDAFVDVVAKLYKRIYSLPEPQRYMDRVQDSYADVCKCRDYLDTSFGKIAREAMLKASDDALADLEYLIEHLGTMGKLCAYVPVCVEERDALVRIREILLTGTYDECRDALMGFSNAGLPTIRKYEYPEIKDSMKTLHDDALTHLTDIRTRFFGATQVQIQTAALDCLDILKELFRLISVIDRQFREEKLSRGIIDFSDSEKYMYQLLVRDWNEETGELSVTAIAEEYRKKYREIYIDEYQDVNPIQDVIFRALSSSDSNGEEMNRFMVGDVKQSIYRFRNARPDLFRGYLDRFCSYDELADKPRACKEYLSYNFRCAKPVIDFTNYVFERIMGNDYSESEHLVYGRSDDPTSSVPCEMILFDKETNDEYYDIEIKLVAEKIQSLVNQKDNEKQISYGDIAVLLRTASKRAEMFASYFENVGIPTYSEVTENFFDHAEIRLCLCLLNTVDNPLRDIYLLGCMRSELFGFDDDDLALIRGSVSRSEAKKTSMWQAVQSFDGSVENNEKLREKCRHFVDTVMYYKKASLGLPSDKLLLKLYAELHLFGVVSSRSFNRYAFRASLRRENLMILYNLAREFEKTSFRGLPAFLDFLSDKMNDPSDIRSASPDGESGCVRIMSIHKSKGLEFPVCIVAGLSHKFNKQDENASLVMSDKNGIGFKLRDIEGIRSLEQNGSLLSCNTPFRSAVSFAETQQLIEEEKRILYVAMTRARDRLIMTMTMPTHKNILKLCLGTSHASCDADWLLSSAFQTDAAKSLIEKEGLTITGAREAPFLRVIHYEGKPTTAYISCDSEHTASDADPALIGRIRERIGYRYPHSSSVVLPSKITVSELKHGLLTSRTEAKRIEPSFLSESERHTGTERGTAMHTFMQYADYALAEQSVEKEAHRLLCNVYITETQFELLDYERLRRFFESSLYLSIKASSEVRREMRFTMKYPANMILGGEDKSASDDFALLQGVIDCFFRNDDGSYSIVDYKTDRVNSMSELFERYGIQLMLYRDAVKEMTGSDVTHIYLYSFHLDTAEEISV